MKKSAPSLLVIIAASLWGTIGVFTRTLTDFGFTAFDLMLARASMTALTLIAYFLIFDREKLKLKLKDLPIFILTSLISCILFNFCYTNAINSGSTGVASTLLYTSPIFVTVISAVIFKEKITKIKIAALILSFSGCVLVSGVLGSEVSLSPKALFFGIASGFTYGLYSIFSKIGMRSYSPLTFTAYTFLTATVILLPFNTTRLFSGDMPCDVKSILVLILFAFVTNVIPYICFTTGLKFLPAGKVNITATIEPVVATLLGVFVFDEKLSLFSLAGIFLVLFSAVILNIPKKD